MFALRRLLPPLSLWIPSTFMSAAPLPKTAPPHGEAAAAKASAAGDVAAGVPAAALQVGRCKAREKRPDDKALKQ